MTDGAPAADGTAPGYDRGSTGYRRLLVALFCAGIATFAQLYAPQAALPLVAADLGVDAEDAALLVSVATLGLALGVLPWSAVADRYGRVRTITVGLCGATALGLAVPFAPGLGLLLAGRFVEGLFVGAVPAVALAYLTEEVRPLHVARAAGTYVAGTTVGGLAGRLVAGPVADLAGWRAGVLAVSVLCALAAAGFVLLAPASRVFVPQPRRRDRVPGDGLARRVAANLRSPRQLALYAQGFLLMGGFVALYNYLGFRLSAPPFVLPQALTSLLFVAYLAGTWSSSRAGGIASRRGRLPVLLGGTALFAGGAALTLAGSLVVVVAGLVVAIAGFFAAHAVASGWTAAEASVGRAQAASLYNFAYYAGSSLLGWLGGVAFTRGGWGGTVALIVGAAALAAAVATAVLGRAVARR
ncbi:MFS transporter [Cellulomonas sp. PhB143]|uniref:MFS transporter n=1 Tax=Cellulomonas sp. PhB143 TaxID=2485186 RepID=UPI000F4A43AF|nr:MFS transporter [Cellulomonas sp. PhB143]ROS73642.1 putative MFS family arabinose efflux permease [Cellulomonas sp. PhB143]